MVPGRFALALEFRDVRCQLVKVDFRGSCYRADLKAETRRRCRKLFRLYSRNKRNDFNFDLIEIVSVFLSRHRREDFEKLQEIVSRIKKRNNLVREIIARTKKK